MVLFLVPLLAASGQASTPPDASRLVISSPTTIAEIDTRRLEGEPFRVAWSPDGSELYLQVARRERSGRMIARHFILPTAPGSTLRDVDEEPRWAASYWSWKSAQAAPGRPAVRIAIEQRDELVRATAAPMGGDLARGSPAGSGGGVATRTGSTINDAASAAYQSQQVRTITLRLHGETLGEWQNAPFVPGLTFGWAPRELAAIAFARPDGPVVVMDVEGRKQELADSKDSLLPAWSDDGARLAYVREAGRNRFEIVVVEVAAQ